MVSGTGANDSGSWPGMSIAQALASVKSSFDGEDVRPGTAGSDSTTAAARGSLRSGTSPLVGSLKKVSSSRGTFN